MKRAYNVAYHEDGSYSETKYISVSANSQMEAYDKAMDKIAEIVGHLPYSLWVESVYQKNGVLHSFNNFEGKPY